ncbi:MAG TPA: glycosyltransferase family 2 protein [Longimicrobiales bacterium]|nr:glycosyltransferase family 2 protein [Longimicrobiales bacterium]
MTFLLFIQYAVLTYFVSVNTFYAVQLTVAFTEMIQHMRRTRGEARWRVLNSRVAPRISILAPAYNEEETVHQSVRALMALQYPRLEVVLINDGSKDRTMEVAIREFGLKPVHPAHAGRIACQEITKLYRSHSHPNLLVVDKLNGGKADALNAGLNLATGDLVCAMDADTLIEPDALQRMVRPFLFDDRIVAAGGTIRIANGSIMRGGQIIELRVPRRPIPGFQIVEYLRAFLFGRLGWNKMGGNLVISGAFGLFKREEVIAVGGYAHGSVGEDIELVLKLRRRGYEVPGTPSEIAFVPDPVAWTEAPETLAVLGRQRDRWHRGLADTLWRHRTIIFNPRYGALGLVVMPYFLIVELMAPVIEAFGVFGLILGLLGGAVNFPFAILFFLLAYGYGMLLTVMTLLLEELSYHRYQRVRDLWVLLGWALLENLGYRQLTVWWRLRGLWKFLRGNTQWGEMTRRGIGQSK